MRKNWQDLLAFVRFVGVRFDQERCLYIAGSLTFTTLLSLVPLVTIALTVFSAFPVFQDFSFQIKTYLLNNLMPEMAGKIITDYMQQFTDSAMRLTAVGIMALGVTAMMLMLTIDHAFNTIWRVTRPRSLFNRLVSSWAVLTLAPLLIGASLSVTSWLVGWSMGYIEGIPLLGVGVLKILPVLFATLAFALLFRLVPNSYVPHAHALIGAFVAALAFESMNRIFGYFVSNFASYKLVYGTFAVIPVFLMWIYLSWVMILIGAVISASLSHWRASATGQDVPALQLLAAIRVLRLLAVGMEQGRVCNFPYLSRSLHVGYDELAKVLERLMHAGMVRRAGRQDWLMIRDTGHIRVTELVRLFVVDRASFAGGRADDPVQQWLGMQVRQFEQGTNITLQELFAQQPA